MNEDVGRVQQEYWLDKVLAENLPLYDALPVSIKLAQFSAAHRPTPTPLVPPIKDTLHE